MQIDTRKLQGTYVYLETLTTQHIPKLRELAKDERIWEYTKAILVNEKFDDQFTRYMAEALDDRNTGGQHSFVIRQLSTNHVIGMTRYYRDEPSHRRINIGYTWYDPEVWGGVENKECKLLLLQFAFETMHYQRVEFEVAHQNERSQKALLKIGAHKEARLRKHGLRADGSVRDTIVFSIIDDEWPQVKAGLQKMIELNEN